MAISALQCFALKPQTRANVLQNRPSPSPLRFEGTETTSPGLKPQKPATFFAKLRYILEPLGDHFPFSIVKFFYQYATRYSNPVPGDIQEFSTHLNAVCTNLANLTSKQAVVESGYESPHESSRHFRLNGHSYHVSLKSQSQQKVQPDTAAHLSITCFDRSGDEIHLSRSSGGHWLGYFHDSGLERPTWKTLTLPPGEAFPAGIQQPLDRLIETLKTEIWSQPVPEPPTVNF